MPNDDLLSRLGALAREQEREAEPALDKLVAGEASAHEVRALEERAATDPALAAQVERLRPVDDGIRARIVERARFELPARAERRKSTRWLVPVTALAAAAAWLLLLRAPETAPLPRYGLRATGGVDQVRGEAAKTVITLAPDSTLDVLLRPAHDVLGPLAARALLTSPAGLELLAQAPQVSKQGAIRLRAEARALFGSRTGAQILWLVACRPEVCDRAVVALRSTAERRGDGWHAESVNVLLTP